MSNSTLKVKTTLTPFRKGGSFVYQFHPVLDRSVTCDAFLKKVADALGTDVYSVRRYWEGFGLTIANLLVQAIGVNGDWIHVGLKIKGSGAKANSVPDPKTNPLMVNLLAKGILAEAAMSLDPQNITATVEAILYAIEQESAGEANLLTAAGENIVATGRNILTESGEDTGVFLMNAAGNVVATATISRTDTDSIEFSFAELPADGEYTLAILTRNGMDAKEYGVSQLERKVTVRTVG